MVKAAVDRTRLHAQGLTDACGQCGTKCAHRMCPGRGSIAADTGSEQMGMGKIDGNDLCSRHSVILQTASGASADPPDYGDEKAPPRMTTWPEVGATRSDPQPPTPRVGFDHQVLV